MTTIETQHVRSLDLRVGDRIKVDLSGMRNKTWQIEAFGNVAGDKDEAAADTDVYGHVIVKVRANTTRNSVPGHGSVVDTEGGLAEIPISKIYLTHTMWPRFSDRAFKPPSASDEIRSTVGTPSTGMQEPNAEMLASKSGRAIVPTAKAMSERASHLQVKPTATAASPTGTQLFSGMAFAISYGSNEAEKTEITRHIQRHGGVILEQGFDELFSLPTLNESAPTSPTKTSPRKADVTKEEVPGLRLRPECSELGFVALIADRHSRRAKYMQALALGLPTISGRWIVDSLNPAKNPNASNADSAPLPWAKYLLPAGESTYLGRAVRSRTMNTYSATTAMLSNVISCRDVLLNGDGVLTVASKKGKATWERRKAYAFLTLALGAGCVRRVSDLTEAKAYVEHEPQRWRWIYVDGSVAEATATFSKANANGKKRKRDGEVKVDAKAMCAENGGVKIVNDEFVVQSLILGALVD